MATLESVFDDITLDQDEAPAAAKERTGGGDRAAELEKLLSQRETELAEARRWASENEQKAYKTEVENVEAKAYAANLERATLQQTKARLDAEEAQLRREHAQAIEVADGTKASELASKLGDLAYQRNVVAGGLQEAERAVSYASKMRETMPEAPKPRQSSDPFETDQFRQLPGAAQSWLKDNKERGYLTPNGLSHKAMAAYHDALSEGFREDSPAFYSHMDKFLGHKAASSEDDDDDAPAADVKQRNVSQKTKVAVAAPVSRSASSESVAKPQNGFRLKAEFASTADRLGMTPDEYVNYAYEATQKGTADARAQAKAFFKQIRA
jgi:hypothetical protein